VSKSFEYIGSYRLLRQLNTGRSAQVWEGVKDGTHYCVKFLNEDMKADKQCVAFLHTEYEAGKEMDHPRVIKLLEGNMTGNPPSIIMEYFDALNLKQLLWEGEKWVIPSMYQIVEGCAEGLAYFHRKGWVHRDVKPDNFLCNRECEVKLIDFSIAQRPKKGFGALFGGKSAIQGTRSYMSPEHIRGENLDARADIYSLGCMIFQMVGGRMPYTGVNSDDLLTKHLKAPVPSIQAANPNLHPDFSALIGRMMAKDKAKRHDNLTLWLREFRKTRMYQTGKAPKLEEDS